MWVIRIPIRFGPAHVVVTCALALLIGVVAGVLWFWIHTSPSSDNPVLKMDASHQDLGVVLPGEHLVLQYELRNEGRSDLQIMDLTPSCGCSSAILDTNPIPPASSGLVTVRFQTPLAAGWVAHSVSFRTNDPDHAEMRLPFQALVRRPIEASPSNLYLGVVASGSTIVHEVELCSTDGAPFDIRESAASVPWIRLEKLASSAPHRQRFRVMVRGQHQFGTITESLKFATSSENQPEVIVPVKGEIVSAHAAMSSRLALPNALPGSVVTGRLELGEFSPARPPFKQVTCKDADWQVIYHDAEHHLRPRAGG